MWRTPLKSRNVPSLNLICKILVTWTWFRLKKWQFLIFPKFSVGHFSETIRDTQLKFSGISYLIDASTWSRFHQNQRRSPWKIFKNWSFLHGMTHKGIGILTKLSKYVQEETMKIYSTHFWNLTLNMETLLGVEHQKLK